MSSLYLMIHVLIYNPIASGTCRLYLVRAHHDNRELYTFVTTTYRVRSDVRSIQLGYYMCSMLARAWLQALSNSSIVQRQQSLQRIDNLLVLR